MKAIKINFLTIFINILVLSELEGFAKLFGILLLGLQTISLAFFFDREAQKCSE